MNSISAVSGATVHIEMEGLRLYERVLVGRRRLTGEIVRLEKGGAVAQVYEDTRGLGIGEPVERMGRPLTAELGPGLLGGMFDGLQRPLERIAEQSGAFIQSGTAHLRALNQDVRWEFVPLKKPGEPVASGEPIGYVEEEGFRHYLMAEPGVSGRIAGIASGSIGFGKAAELEGGLEIALSHHWPVREPRPCRRKLPLSEPLVTGLRSIDLLYPLARGGVAIVPGGFGTGKTVLEQSIAKQAAVDIVIYVGCGERGNEMADLLHEFQSLTDPWSGKPLRRRTVLVVNTSNMPVAAREASLYMAAAMAEYYRDMGYHVLLLADSLSRWAEALREISTSLEELPGEEGYPTYLASRLAGFIERAGMVETMDGRRGSVSMVLSVSPPGGDFTEPVTQACLRVAGALLMLDTSLAQRRHFPALNWMQSYSLYERDLDAALKGFGPLRSRARCLLNEERGLREITEVVGFEGLQDADRLLMRTAGRLRDELLRQDAYGDDAFSTPEQTIEKAGGIFRSHDEEARALSGQKEYRQRDAP